MNTAPVKYLVVVKLLVSIADDTTKMMNESGSILIVEDDPINRQGSATDGTSAASC